MISKRGQKLNYLPEMSKSREIFLTSSFVNTDKNTVAQRIAISKWHEKNCYFLDV